MLKDYAHVGISVKDLEASVKFYTEIMGMEEVTRVHHTGDKISQIVGIENADIDVSILKKGPMIIELFDYKNKDAKTQATDKRQDIPGLIHIAFMFENVDEMYAKIKTQGYEFNTPPMVTRKNGHKVAYFKGPDNVMIEIVEAS